MRMQECQVKPGRLRAIFISHLHGDHCFGLIGLLTSLNLTGRDKPLNIYSPPGLRGMIEAQLAPTGTALQFPVHFHEVDPTVHSCITEDHLVKVYTIPLDHRIPCCGYLFREKERERNIYPEKIQEYDLSVTQIVAAKRGEDIRLADGRKIASAELTTPPPPPRAYAFCSDTRYKPDIIPVIKGVDLLYHESTFCQEYAKRATETGHSTALQAAQIARDANVGKLILGHYSSRYPDPSVFAAEAKTLFGESHAGLDGQTYTIPFDGRKIDDDE